MARSRLDPIENIAPVRNDRERSHKLHCDQDQLDLSRGYGSCSTAKSDLFYLGISTRSKDGICLSYGSFLRRSQNGVQKRGAARR